MEFQLKYAFILPSILFLGAQSFAGSPDKDRCRKISKKYNLYAVVKEDQGVNPLQFTICVNSKDEGGWLSLGLADIKVLKSSLALPDQIIATYLAKNIILGSVDGAISFFAHEIGVEKKTLANAIYIQVNLNETDSDSDSSSETESESESESDSSSDSDSNSKSIRKIENASDEKPTGRVCYFDSTGSEKEATILLFAKDLKEANKSGKNKKREK